jgi:hypothetical protein
VGLVDGSLQSSGTQTRVRTKHLRRDPRATLFVFDTTNPWRWVGLEATVTIVYRAPPAGHKQAIGACQDRLIAMAKTKDRTRKEVGRPPDHPGRRTMSVRQASRTSFMMQPAS